MKNTKELMHCGTEYDIIVNNEPIEDVNECMHLGAIVDKEWGGDKDTLY